MTEHDAEREAREWPTHVVAGALKLCRESFPNDGAEGESVHVLCDAVAHLRAASEAYCAERDALRKRVAEVERLERELADARSALSTINGIRNSIIGFQKVNFSEHVYPLVAALKTAGFEGATYDDARKDAGTLVEQIRTAERERDEAQAALERVRAAAGSYLAAQGACVDAEGQCSICHCDACTYCALAAAVDGPGCSEDCDHE